MKVEDQDVKLPCMRLFLLRFGYSVLNRSLWIAGELVLDGTDFRNGAHLRFKADLFVPCGGRLV